MPDDCRHEKEKREVFSSFYPEDVILAKKELAGTKNVGHLGADLKFEPSGQDFLSPCLAEADLMRRILPPRQFADWLGGFLPEVPRDGTTDWLPIAVVTDRRDGKLAHLDGLNISRAWMLEGIASGLPAEDPRRESTASYARRP